MATGAGFKSKLGCIGLNIFRFKWPVGFDPQVHGKDLSFLNQREIVFSLRSDSAWTV